MTKKNITKTDEPVAECDQFEVTKCDIKNIRIENLIRTIRGQQVMLDSDLAMLYGVKNKRLNEQVKRNPERFPADFMFQLTKQELNTLKSQFATTKDFDNESITNLKSQFATSSWRVLARGDCPLCAIYICRYRKQYLSLSNNNLILQSYARNF